jgi:VWFA-related protein
MRFRVFIAFTVFALVATSGVRGQQQQSAPPPQQPPPASPAQRSGSTFRSAVNLILVDVDVRDKSGQPIKNLKQSDFEVIEDGKTQEIVTFAYEEITAKANAIETSSTLAKSGDAKGAVTVTVAPPKPAATPTPTPTPEKPEDHPPAVDASTNGGQLTQDQVAGHRIWVLLFDTSSMQPEDLQKAADGAVNWAKTKMGPADLVAIASIGSTLQVLLDFTTDQTKVLTTLQAFSAAEGTAALATDVDASTMSNDETNATAAAADTTVDASAQELDTFNNDVRLRGLKTICDGLLPWQQKKAILYFSSGMARNGSDNQVELRAATNSCTRANTTLNTVDARGLQAVPPGGSGRTASRSGVGAFSGANVAAQFTRLNAEQETLQTLAADTGGTAFTDSNDFGEAFDKVQKDISAYYILGYASANPAHDGRYRSIQVKLKAKLDAKVHAREGYYADRDFTHTDKTDRETALQEQLMMAIPATDVPLFVTSGYFRLPATTQCAGGGRGRGFGGPGGPGGPGGRGGGDQEPTGCYYVPISLAVPGDAVPPSKDAETLDIRGYVRDERGIPFATIKDTLTVPPSTKDTLASKQVLYQTGTTLPPGHYRAKVVVRENISGQMGTFEAEITVPDLKKESVKVSSVVLSTQLQSAAGRKTVSPLVRDNVEMVPNLTHVVSQDQKLYFYYEVYDPNTSSGAKPQIRTSLAFYRGKVKVFETPIVERDSLDVADRKAAIFQFEVPADQFKPGLYTCQVNIVDEVASAFTFPRIEMYVRPAAKASGQ